MFHSEIRLRAKMDTIKKVEGDNKFLGKMQESSLNWSEHARKLNEDAMFWRTFNWSGILKLEDS